MQVICPQCQISIDSTSAIGKSELLCPSCGSNISLVVGSTQGWTKPEELRRLGRFDLIEIVGNGAFGTVYKANDPQLDRTVAIKVPRSGTVPTTADLDRFLREARSVARLRHPSIVPVFEVGEHDGMPFLVSEFVQGVTLGDMLSARRPTSRKSAELIVGAADALQFAHDNGVVHRDVKPSNIMLDKDNVPHLMDFGLAKRDAGEATMTLEGQVLGTPAYMSPEQARGDAHRVDGRSDVYSLGVILYQLLTGELPFRGTARMLLHQVLNDEPRPPRSLSDLVPRDLETICLKAMSKEPARRYQKASEMSEDLRRFLDGQPIKARPVGKVERLSRWCRRNPALAWLTASVGTLLLVVAVTSTVLAINISASRNEALRVAREQERLRTQAEEKEQENRRLLVQEKQLRSEAEKKDAENRQLLGEQHTVNGSRALDQGNVVGAVVSFAEALRLDRDDAERLGRHAQRVANCLAQLPRPHRVWFHDERIDNVVLSPDSSTLLVVSGQQIHVWDPLTGKPIREPLQHDQPIWYTAFSPEGRRVVTVSYARPARPTDLPVQGVVRLWDVERGTFQTLPWSTGGLLPQFSPRGTRLMVCDSSGGVRIWDVQRSQPSPDDPETPGITLYARFSPDDQLLLTVSGDTARVWDATTGKAKTAAVKLTAPPTAAVFSAEGPRVLTNSAAGLKDGEVRVWDVTAGRSVLLPLKRSTRVQASLSPDGLRVLTSYPLTSEVGPIAVIVQIWDTVRGRQVAANRFYGESCPVFFTPDGRRALFMASLMNLADGMILDTTTANMVGGLTMYEGGVGHQPQISPDGGRVLLPASPSPGAGVRVWELTSGQPGAVIPLRADARALFSPDGRFVLTLSSDRSVELWPAADSLHSSRMLNHEGRVSNTQISADSGKVVTISDSRAQVWNPRTGQALSKPLDTTVAAKPSIGPSPYSLGAGYPQGQFGQLGQIGVLGQLGALGQFGQFGQLGALGVGGQIGSPGQIGALGAIGALGQIGAIGALGQIGALGLGAIGQIGAVGQIGGLPSGYASRTTTGSLSPDGQRLWLLSSDGNSPPMGGVVSQVDLWDVSKGHPAGPPFKPGKRVADVVTDRIGRRVAVVSHSLDGLEGVSSLTQMAGAVSNQSGTASLGLLALWWGDQSGRFYSSYAGGRLFSSVESEIRIWDVVKNEGVGPLHRFSENVRQPQFSPDSRTLLTVHSVLENFREVRGEVRLWNTETGEPVGRPIRQPAPLQFVVVSQDSRRILTLTQFVPGTEGNEVRIWDLATGASVGNPIRSGSWSIYRAEFSPDGKRLLTVHSAQGPGNRGELRVWDATTGEPLFAPVKIESMLGQEPGFTPNGRQILIAGGIDSTIRLLDASTGQPTFSPPLRLFGGMMFGIGGPPQASVSADGRLLLTVATGMNAFTTEVRIWDAATGQPVTPPLISGNITQASFTPDARHVVMINSNGEVHVWDLPASSRSADELWRLTRALSRNGIGRTGIVPLDGDEWRKDWQAQWATSAAEMTSPVEDMPVWHAWLADEYEKVGDWSAALWHLEQLRPRESALLGRWHRRRAEALLGMKEWVRADEAFHQALTAGEENWQVHYGLALTHLNREEWEKASTHLGRAASFAGAPPQVGADYALVSLYLRDPKHDYRRICRTQYDQPDMRSCPHAFSLLKAICLLDPDSLDRKEWLEFADSTGGILSIRREQALYRTGQWQDAAKLLPEFPKTNQYSEYTNAVWDNFFRAMICQRVDRKEEAQQWLDLAQKGMLNLFPDKSPDVETTPNLGVPQPPPPSWQVRLGMTILRDEATKLVAPK